MQAVIAPKKIFGAKKRAFKLVSKFIFSSFSHKFFLILHIMIDSNDIKQIRVFPLSKKKFGPKKCPDPKTAN